MTQVDHDRYLRMRATANKSAAAEQWVAGYEAGWASAAERWMSSPQLNDVARIDDTTDWLTDEDAA